MTGLLSSPGLPAPASVDRVRLIRRSMRCFVFGLLGAVPLLGLGPACLALWIQKDLAEESGEPAPLGGTEMVAISIGAFIVAVVLLACDHAGLVLAMGFLLPALEGYWLLRQYQRAEPRRWNPARHLVYWGAGLACAGLVLSSTIILLVLGAAFRGPGS
jgi:hypothetical protein